MYFYHHCQSNFGACTKHLLSLEAQRWCPPSYIAIAISRGKGMGMRLKASTAPAAVTEKFSGVRRPANTVASARGRDEPMRMDLARIGFPMTTLILIASG